MNPAPSLRARQTASTVATADSSSAPTYAEVASTATPSLDENHGAPSVAGGAAESDKGFVGLLVQSIWEPGVNYAVVMAMNVSFFLLILVLFALAFLTSWNKHVLLLLGVTTLLWGAMLWFIVEITKMQSRPDNLPPGDPSLGLGGAGSGAGTGAGASDFGGKHGEKSIHAGARSGSGGGGGSAQKKDP